MDIRHQVGGNIRRIRLEADWSQEDLAFEAGLDRTYISGVERGVRNPTITVIAEIAAALGVPVSELFLSTAERRRGR